MYLNNASTLVTLSSKSFASKVAFTGNKITVRIPCSVTYSILGLLSHTRTHTLAQYAAFILETTGKRRSVTSIRRKLGYMSKKGLISAALVNDHLFGSVL